MRGYVTFGERSFERGHERGEATGTDLMFHLTIEVDDIDRLAADPGCELAVRGHVRCEALGGRFTVERGAFHLFAAGEGRLDRRMLYRLPLVDGTGHPLTLTGFKRLDPGAPTRLWPETTTLYVRLVRGHVDAAAEPGAELVASGILHIRPLDFLRQLTTFRASPPSILGRFARLFLGVLWRLYGPVRR